ncbi:hypothetical protein MHYP_G00340830 [Metynnis hypsauchen]
MEKNYKKSSYAHLMYGDVSYRPGTVTLHAHDGPLVVYAPAGGQDGGSFFPDIWEKEHRTGMNPHMQPGHTKFPLLPVKSGAGNMGPPVKCHVLPNAAEPSSSAVSPPGQTAGCNSLQAECAVRSTADLKTDAIHLVQMVQLSSTTVPQSDESQNSQLTPSADFVKAFKKAELEAENQQESQHKQVVPAGEQRLTL